MPLIFNDALTSVFKSSIKAHFASESLGTERQKVFDIEKSIVETIVGKMIIDPVDDVNSDKDKNSLEEDAGFGSRSELQALLLNQRGATVATAQDRAILLFMRANSEEDEENYSYSVTFPKAKTVFVLVVRYMSCGTSFRMESNIIGCTYNVLASPGLRACSRQDVATSLE
ncbi:hypothetical protein MHU86_6519 [Fragilaria crotonensis]|nr:hypothetical protein MHU86_6519 [Fragilaria crotonensis]